MYIFEREGAEWREVARVGPDTDTTFQDFGADVGISPTHAIVGVPKDDAAAPPDSGAAFVFD